LLEPAIKVLESVPSSADTELAKGRVQGRLGWFYNDRGLREKALATCDKGLRILRQHDSPEDLMAALYSQGLITFFLNQLDITLNCSQEGLGIARSIGDDYWTGNFLIWAEAATQRHDLGSAVQLIEEALAIFRDLGNCWGIQSAYMELGRIKVLEGDHE